MLGPFYGACGAERLLFLRIFNRNVPVLAITEFTFDLVCEVAGTQSLDDEFPANEAVRPAIQGKISFRPMQALWVHQVRLSAGVSPIHQRGERL